MTLGWALLIIAAVWLIEKHHLWKRVAKIAGAVLVLYAASANAQSLDETTEWIHDFVEARGYVFGPYGTDDYHVNFAGCAITVIDNQIDRSCSLPEIKCGDAHSPSYIRTFKSNLKDFDPGASDDIQEADRYTVILRPRNDRLVVMYSIDKVPVSKQNVLKVNVDSLTAVKRLVKAFNHAITLCGGKASTF